MKKLLARDDSGSQQLLALLENPYKTMVREALQATVQAC